MENIKELESITTEKIRNAIDGIVDSYVILYTLNIRGKKYSALISTDKNMYSTIGVMEDIKIRMIKMSQKNVV